MCSTLDPKWHLLEMCCIVFRLLFILCEIATINCIIVVFTKRQKLCVKSAAVVVVVALPGPKITMPP